MICLVLIAHNPLKKMPSRYPPPTQTFPSNSGIAIGPILFIIAILAVLAAAIAAGSGSFTGGTTTESDKTKAGAIIQQAELMQEGVQKLITENNCADTQISFSNPVITGINGSDVYANPNSPSDLSCNLFQPNGGGLTFPIITASTQASPTDGAHFIFEGSNGFWGLGNGGSGTIPALAAFLPIDSSTLCQQIDTMLGLQQYWGAGDYFFVAGDASDGRFKGTYNFGNNIVDDQGTWPGGKLMGCIQSTQPTATLSNYFFFVVLLVR